MERITMNGDPYFYSLNPDGGAIVGVWSHPDRHGRTGAVLVSLVSPSSESDVNRLLDSLSSNGDGVPVPLYHLSPGSLPRRSDVTAVVHRSRETGAVTLQDRGRWYVESSEPTTGERRCLLPVPGLRSMGTGEGVRLTAAVWCGLSR